MSFKVLSIIILGYSYIIIPPFRNLLFRKRSGQTITRYEILVPALMKSDYLCFPNTCLYKRSRKTRLFSQRVAHNTEISEFENNTQYFCHFVHIFSIIFLILGRFKHQLPRLYIDKQKHEERSDLVLQPQLLHVQGDHRHIRVLEEGETRDLMNNVKLIANIFNIIMCFYIGTHVLLYS